MIFNFVKNDLSTAICKDKYIIMHMKPNKHLKLKTIMGCLWCPKNEASGPQYGLGLLQNDLGSELYAPQIVEGGSDEPNEPP